MTTTATKQPIQAYSNNKILTDKLYDLPLDPETTEELFTLRGRVEFFKDLRAIYRAASLTGAIVNVGGIDEVEVSFLLGSDTQQRVDKFVVEVIRAWADQVEEFKGMGIEPHVYLESLKPVELYDAERNGPLAMSYDTWRELI